MAPLLVAFLAAAGTPRAAETVRAVARTGDHVRAVQIRREGGDLLVPLFACGTLLGAEARWNAASHRWSLQGRTAVARGFLDEPLILLSGQPILLKTPARLLAGAPYLPLEALRLLGRLAWELDIVWDDGASELLVRPAQARAPDLAPRTRTVTVPAVPAGARAVVLDAGHARSGGVHGLRGAVEGDLALRFASSAGATLAAAPGVAPVIMQGQDDAYEPSEIASMANAVGAERFVSVHASEHGAPGIAVWCWDLGNMLATGIAFAPFEPAPAGGPLPWAYAAAAEAPRSLALARRLVRALQEAGIPAHGPYLAPLLALEGVGCPGVVVDIEGLSTAEGAAFAADADAVARAGAITGAVLLEELGSAPPGDAP